MEGTEFGRYRLVELLGRGGMGEVWRAYDTTARRVVALKVLLASWASDPKFQQRFLREAYAAAALTDPHVVPIHNFGEIDGRLYVDMRLVEGRDLDAVVAEGPLDATRAVMIVEQVASALNAAHKVGLVHRDIKPSNILLTENDFAYLIDFGIAKAAEETRLTGTGGVVGSWAYMAPERFDTDADWRADIYALACVLHECLTGDRPFGGDELARQYTAHKFTPPPQPSVVRPGVPASLDEVIAKGMAKDPEQRYQSGPELAAAARAALTAPIARLSPPPPLPDPQAHNFVNTVPAAVPPVQPPRPPVQPPRPPVQPPRPPVEPPRPPVEPPRPPAHSARSDDRLARTGRAISTRMRWIIAAAVLVLLVASLVIGWSIIRQHYYVAEYDGNVTIMRGSLALGFLTDPYLVGCVNAQNELSTVSVGSSRTDCSLLKLTDLYASGQSQVQAGLPGGNFGDALGQLKTLVANYLLPACAGPRLSAPEPTTAATPTPTSLPPITATPTPSATTTSPAYVPTSTTLPPPPKPGVDCREAV